MTNAPLVSILIPAYNRQDLIEECIRSALNQTYANIEVVVFDNASTDQTFNVINSLAKEDTRIRHFRNEQNVGPVLNWKLCIAEARGEYAKILFSDDVIRPTFIEETMQVFTPEVGFVFTAAEIGPKPGDGSNHYFWRNSTGTQPNTEYWHDVVFCKNLIPVSPCAGIFRASSLRKNLIEKIEQPDSFDFLSHGAGPDFLLYLLTSADYPKVGFVNSPLTFFRSHATSITTSDSTGRVASGYFRATLWFWEKQNQWPYHIAAVRRKWIEQMKKEKKWISLSRFLAQYSMASFGVKYYAVFLKEAGSVVLKKKILTPFFLNLKTVKKRLLQFR
jgi:glycosyltransferase involved in cell wall biosynthesis